MKFYSIQIIIDVMDMVFSLLRLQLYFNTTCLVLVWYYLRIRGTRKEGENGCLFAVALQDLNIQLLYKMALETTDNNSRPPNNKPHNNNNNKSTTKKQQQYKKNMDKGKLHVSVNVVLLLICYLIDFLYILYYCLSMFKS